MIPAMISSAVSKRLTLMGSFSGTTLAKLAVLASAVNRPVSDTLTSEATVVYGDVWRRLTSSARLARDGRAHAAIRAYLEDRAVRCF
jgi:hypothetical protein